VCIRGSAEEGLVYIAYSIIVMYRPFPGQYYFLYADLDCDNREPVLFSCLKRQYVWPDSRRLEVHRDRDLIFNWLLVTVYIVNIAKSP
jgi:hypothetical protein